MLQRKKAEKLEKEQQIEEKRNAPKPDPRADAIARRPVGHLRLRGVLVPPPMTALDSDAEDKRVFEEDKAMWRYVRTAPVRGWALQHSGPHRMHSLWMRTDYAW